ncbi:hypothetical protein [Acinetobacter sp. SWBY1]|uniref:hypothetical protein n=1 Tax=Acinetobacter sp. SWBY1 TaxID=2079596 RepID=UPI000CF2CDCE|nr:hypothetical protein [Acinetobacter sp. SWBY1]AVH50194.1 hypothetical protein C3Y93_11665 [Acinetobacter sp. SWBY1]
MNKISFGIAIGLLLSSAAVCAQNSSEPTQDNQSHKPIRPYADNPNLLHVWAYKTQEDVIQAAQKVGEVTEKGIEKIRPSAHQALDNAKTLGSQGAAQAKQTGQQLAGQVNNKIQETKEVITGQSDQAVPIYQAPLSAPSQNIAPAATTTAPNQEAQTQAAPSAEAEEEIKVIKL